MSTSWLPYDESLDQYSRQKVINLLRLFLLVIPGIAIVLAVIDFLLGFTDIALITLSVPVFCGISLLALNRGYINISMVIIVSIMIISTSIICILGARIHEIGIIIFPVIVFFSSLVMNMRGVIATTSLVVISIGMIVFGEYLGFFPKKAFVESGWVDLTVAHTVVIIHTFITFGFSNITKNNLRRIQDELKNQQHYKDEIAENLIEKTELLRLVHHRVKNNLLLVNSLIELETYGKPDVKEELREITESIHTIARAHDPLYHTDDYKQVAVKPYFEKLIATFIQSTRIRDIYAELADRFIFHEKALLLGIILQKILTSITAVNETDQLELFIYLGAENTDFTLLIRTNNDHELLLEDTSLIELLTQEINGKLKVESKEISISFSEQ